MSQHARLRALEMAKRFDAKPTVVHVAPLEAQTPIPMEPVPVELDWQKKRGAQGLARLEGFEALHIFPHEIVLKQGSPWPEIRDLIEQRGIDLIVLGPHGRGLIGTLRLGSVAEQVLRHATGPVLTVGPDVLTGLLDHERFAHILFATHFSDGSLHALPYALSLAEENDAELTLMQVLEQLEPLSREYSKELLSEYRSRLWQLVPDEANLWYTPQVTVAIGTASDEIVRTAGDRQVDLIVMGVHQQEPWPAICHGRSCTRRFGKLDARLGQFFCRSDRLIKRRTGCNNRCAGDDSAAKTLSHSNIEGVVRP